MNGFDLSTISAAYLGSVAINEIYLGSTKIWPAGLPIGTIYNFAYTGTVQSQELPAGTYKLQVWGAQGGTALYGGDAIASGSKGGYSEGVLVLSETTTLYVFVGGKGTDEELFDFQMDYLDGGWNGGGCAMDASFATGGYFFPRSGGGATDIALVRSRMTYINHVTSRSSSSLNSRLIVAGGGAGACVFMDTNYNYAPSDALEVGGGESGGGDLGGTQSEAGDGGGFGYGASQYEYGSGAGGGGYYGGGCTEGDDATAINKSGGGSGYIGGVVSGKTYQGTSSFPSTSGSTETGHSGDGYARITCIDKNTLIPLTIEALGAGTIGWKTTGSSFAKTIQYSKNGGTWTNITSTTSGAAISVANGDVVQFRGDNTTYGNSSYYNCFTTTCDFNVSGNIMSLISSTGYADLKTLSATYTFRGLFTTSKVKDASNLVLPATTLQSYCYQYIFYNCYYLTAAPKILPATTLSSYCYRGLFQGCSLLTTTPELPAATVPTYAYYRLFYNCAKINRIKCLATSVSASNAVTEWVYGVAATGTFVKKSTMSSWSTGNSGIPSGWTVQNATS